jgi:putative intracellular protease/amidase
MDNFIHSLRVAHQWIKAVSGDKITWVPKARWVIDGNTWTSSGVSAGEFYFLSAPPFKMTYASLQGRTWHLRF